MEGLDRDSIIIFTGEGCRSCEVSKPIYHKFFGKQNQEYVMIDARVEPEAAKYLNVRGIPTVLFIKNGDEQARVVGVPNLEKLVAAYENWVDKDGFTFE